MRKIYDTIKKWWKDVNNNPIMKVILSPIKLTLKILFFVGGGLAFVYGIFYAITKHRGPVGIDDVDYIPDTQGGHLIINREIVKIDKRIREEESKLRENDYRDLTKEEIDMKDEYDRNPELKGKTMDEKKIIFKAIKKIELVRTPTDSISDQEGLL